MLDVSFRVIAPGGVYPNDRICVDHPGFPEIIVVQRVQGRGAVGYAGYGYMSSARGVRNVLPRRQGGLG